MQTSLSLLTDDRLIELAGKGAFGRGREYYAQGRVQLLRSDDSGFEAKAQGSETYRLWYAANPAGENWGCSCPAAAGGDFCKHLVAAVFCWRDGETKAEPAQADTLGEYLRAQPAERLAGWLEQLADEDREIERRLRLYQAETDPAALKKALGKLLVAGGFLDYRRSMDYARRLDTVYAQLEEQARRAPAVARALCEYVIGRLFRIYANSDDSAGMIGGAFAMLAGLHAHICAAAPGEGATLARTLHNLQVKDDWGLFPLADYWEALGETGQAAYGRLIDKELAGLPKQAGARGESFYVRKRAADFARQSRDFDLAMRVLQWRIESAADYLDLIAACREFDRAREATKWAERGVKAFPDDERLHLALAECLQIAGLDEEALEHCWTAFQLRPDETQWDRLKQASGSEWPAWRERALAILNDHKRGDGASQQVHLLLRDNDLEAALAVAQQATIHPSVLQRLAQRIEAMQSEAAGALYLRLAKHEEENLEYKSYPRFVQHMQRVTRLLPEAQWREWFDQAVEIHRRKSKLMALLQDKALI